MPTEDTMLKALKPLLSRLAPAVRREGMWPRARLRLGLALSILLPATPLQAFDMRSCPLDSLTFIDTWSGAEFEVERVGQVFYYLCGEARDYTRAPSDHAACRGPYGEVVLSGRYREGAASRPLSAIYNHHSSGAPCCGWHITEDPEANRETPVEWLPKDRMPRLGDWPLGALDNSWGGPDDLNGMVPLICEGSSS